MFKLSQELAFQSEFKKYTSVIEYGSLFCFIIAFILFHLAIIN